MYVREKVVRRGKNEYRYFQLVQSTWVEGKSRQTVVQHLGPFGNHGAAERHAKQAGYICGAEDCYEPPTIERKVWERKGKGREATVSLCDEHATELKAAGTLRIRPYDPDKAASDREIIRRTGRGGRPPFRPQDRDSAMQPTDFDAAD